MGSWKGGSTREMHWPRSSMSILFKLVPSPTELLLCSSFPRGDGREGGFLLFSATVYLGRHQ